MGIGWIVDLRVNGLTMDLWALGVVAWLIFLLLVRLVAWLIYCLLGLLLCRCLILWLWLQARAHAALSSPKRRGDLGRAMVRQFRSRPWLARGQ